MNTSGNYTIFMFPLDFGFPKTVRNDQLPIKFWECDIDDKVLKVLIFENTYL